MGNVKKLVHQDRVEVLTAEWLALKHEEKLGIRKSWLWSVLLSVDEQTPTFVKACCILPKGGV